MKSSRLPILAAIAALLLTLPARAAGPGGGPGLRLPAGVRPERYALELTVVPERPGFTGAVDVAVALEKRTDTLWLHGVGLTVSEAWLERDGKRSPAAATASGGFLRLALGEPAEPGKATLHLAFASTFALKETAGLFRQRDGDAWYVYSQFEATDARRAFPCFDEPSYKVPVRLTLRVPQGLVAAANTPVVSETPGPDGLKTVVFAESRPLPTYLVALAVGPFDVVDGGRWGQKLTPVRFLVPRGHAGEARYAAEVTGEILARLESWFGIAYPYEKLDQVVIPETVGFGAMENAGLVTYAQSIHQARAADETTGFRRNYASICAHELAHQWFGDLVTMAWWDDVWLNESFATWMAQKTLEAWKPEWAVPVSRVSDRSDVMGEDTLATARRIRQPIESPDDIANAFDGITYQKGSAVLSMFEAWLSPAVFRKGVRRYLNAHAFGNATARDFVGALSAEAGRDVAAPFFSFLDQPGVPLVHAELRCDAGSPPSLRLSQSRFVPVGSTAPAGAWRLPVCARYPAGDGTARACILLEAPTGTLELPGAASCPAWVLANDGLAGYYRTAYADGLLNRLLGDGRSALALHETAGVLGDAAALVETGEIPMADALALVPRFAPEPARPLVSGSRRIAAGAVSAHLVSGDLRVPFSRFVERCFGERARALGFVAKPGEDEETRLLRTGLVEFVARHGSDPRLGVEAGALARRWLDDRAAVPADMASAVLRLAAERGDRALHERLLAAAKKSTDRRERGRLLFALGSFRDPELARASYALVLSDAFDPREAVGVLWAGLSDERTAPLVYDFVTSSFDALVRRLPRDYPANLVYAGSAFCDDGKRRAVEAFFRERVGAFAGGPHRLDQTLEGIGLCAAFRARQQASVAEFLKAY